jgi:hypothetical protein
MVSAWGGGVLESACAAQQRKRNAKLVSRCLIGSPTLEKQECACIIKRCRPRFWSEFAKDRNN